MSSVLLKYTLWYGAMVFVKCRGTLGGLCFVAVMILLVSLPEERTTESKETKGSGLTGRGSRLVVEERVWRATSCPSLPFLFFPFLF